MLCPIEKYRPSRVITRMSEIAENAFVVLRFNTKGIHFRCLPVIKLTCLPCKDD
jgi:hypothetical protein